MVDRDAVCLKNVMSYKLNKFNFFDFLTNLGPISVNVLFFLLLDKPLSYITVDLIFYAPNLANLGF